MVMNMQEEMPTEEEVRNALRSVIDPEVGLNIVDLGLIYCVEVADKILRIDMTMTTPACPMGEMIMDNSRQVLRGLMPEGAEIELNLVWEPPWTPENMGEYARGYFGWDQS